MTISNTRIIICSLIISTPIGWWLGGVNDPNKEFRIYPWSSSSKVRKGDKIERI